MNRQRGVLAVLIGVTLWGLSVIGHALDVAVYRVEIVVFEHLHKNGTEEAQPIYTGRPNSNGAIDLSTLSPKIEEKDGVALLPRGQQALSDTVANLQQNKGYRVLVHEAWEQPLQPVRKIAFFKGVEPWAVQAVVELKQRRALYVTTDLLFERGTDKRRLFFSGAQGELTGFRIEDARPIRLKEIEYIDHPKFGVLLHVVKAMRHYEDEAPKAAPEAEQASPKDPSEPEKPLITEIGI